MSKEKQNIIYVEPGHWINKNNANDMRYGMYIGNEENSMDYIEFAPDIQDYCVTVDLQVVVPKTTYGVDDGNETYVMRFTSSNNSNSSDISFFSGTKHTFDNVEIVDLSTSPYDCMTYQDVISGADTKELFGINSIDIEYNNYAVPVVTINFTDIRGIGLFSTEEERHDENGTPRDNIVNSFFKCFFKFPYPKFSLMVKGFYGHPVTYELFCADFKANFDSNSGNFNAIAKFVGYSFSLLNDVTMNAIIAAPLSHYHGQQYWAKQVENGNFYFDDKITPIPTFLQFLDNYKKLQSNNDNIGDYKELNDLEDNLKLVNEAINAYDVYYDSLINDFKDKPTFSNDNKNKVFYYDNGFNSSVKTDSLSRDSENCVFTLKKILEKLNVANLLPICTINREGLRHSDPLTELLKNAPSPYITIIFDGYNLLTFLDNKKNELTHELNNINKKISQKIIDEQIKILGFEPNVKNITYMILAHLDTLLSCIYNCAIEVKNTKRTISDFNFETNKFVDGLKNVNAFPEVHKKTNDGNRNENAWIEDVVYDSSDAPEINLIHGLLNGIDAFETMAQTAKEANPINRSFSKLVTFTDIFSENPFSFLTDTNNISEFVAILSIRMLNVLGTNNISGNTKLINEMGKADAKNFAFVSNVPSDTFFTYIKNGGTLHDFTKFLNIALGKDKNYEFSFGDDGIIIPIEKNGKDYVSRNSIKDEKLTWIKSIPINEIDIEAYDSLTKITYDNNQYNNENYINLLSNVKLSQKDNSNIIKFDLEVDKYINLYTNYENNTELYKRFSIDNSIATFEKYYDFHNHLISREITKLKDKKYALKNDAG